MTTGETRLGHRFLELFSVVGFDILANAGRVVCFCNCLESLVEHTNLYTLNTAQLLCMYSNNCIKLKLLTKLFLHPKPAKTILLFHEEQSPELEGLFFSFLYTVVK